MTDQDAADVNERQPAETPRRVGQQSGGNDADEWS
jgi:hypothetical protein